MLELPLEVQTFARQARTVVHVSVCWLFEQSPATSLHIDGKTKYTVAVNKGRRDVFLQPSLSASGSSRTYFPTPGSPTPPIPSTKRRNAETQTAEARLSEQSSSYWDGTQRDLVHTNTPQPTNLTELPPSLPRDSNEILAPHNFLRGCDTGWVKRRTAGQGLGPSTVRLHTRASPN